MGGVEGKPKRNLRAWEQDEKQHGCMVHIA